ncbi:NACHT and WD repeat domain-containing protein 2 [Aplysia californica]|uniref:NACHT and WD repeat domain-containing protein 2 n=1 Tax=Aplysia californica TaxID=6500 RepID=A0ABM1AAG7_APLCA|nr:NACHT and WD repeat domain-containing protein 2 [Aplysia californica]
MSKSSSKNKVKGASSSSTKEDSNLSNHKSVNSSGTTDGSDPGGKVVENGGSEEAGEGEDAVTDQERQEREKLMKVLSGNMEDLPPLSSKIVRIFTSSTFTDTTLERNNLMEKVYPRIKDYCREKHGLEFQVVDMRWGVRDEATDDHMTTKLCMQEIVNCQRVSMGPNFIVFLGQKYGYRPIPAEILASEFELLRECAKQDPNEVKLLDEWYKRDDNFVPAVYVLQPISSIFTNFNNKRHQRLMENDQAAWWDTFTRLTRIIRKAAQVLFITKKIDREQRHNFFMSVTEREVENGILKAADVEEHCLAYIREISNMNTTLLRIASKFVDFAARSVDGEAQTLLKKLRDEKLPAKLPASSTARFTVDWSGKDGIDEELHKDYFEKFCAHFYENVIKLVDRAMAKHARMANDQVYLEPLQHLHSCNRYCKAFQGREDVVEQIHEYVIGDNKLPLVLWGESGCGKTSLMAKAASQVVTSWFSTPVVMALRFLGTTPGSSTIIPLLTSYCQQLSKMYDQPMDEIPDELAPLQQHFKKLINLASAEMPLVLFFDSLDQLSGADGAHNLTWMPIRLPDHVKVIISVLPNYYGLLDLLRVMIENEDSFIQVLPLGQNLGGTIIRAWLDKGNKAVTEEQWALVNEAISKCNLPLFVKLTFDEICRWRSYTKPSQTTLAFTIHDCIMLLFERIELQHGKTLVSHALGYITASKSGVSEPELEDLISLDDKVLNDIYQYHLPPVRRIPPLLWTRIRNDLPGYLSEREADGVSVIGWYHRQFIDAAKERYFRNLNFASTIHSNTAEYFLGIYGGGIPKPFEYSDLQRQRFHLEDKQGSEDRKVPPQPLEFLDSKGKVIRHNLRKLSEMPYHLIRSHRFEDLYDKVIFNYNWLHAKLSSMPLQSVVADFEDLLNHVYDKDVRVIADAIRLSSSILSHYPDMVGPQITGRLLPYYSQNPKIRGLIQQCDSDGLRHCALVSAYHCLHTPSGPLQYSLEGHQFAPFGIQTPADGKNLVSVSNKIIMWDLATGEISRNITPGIEGIMQNLNISPNGKFAVSYTNNNQVVVCALNTGDFKIISPNVPKTPDSIKGTSVSNTHIAVWTEQTSWLLYAMDGSFVSEFKSELKMPVLNVDLNFVNDGPYYTIVKSGAETDTEMALEVHDQSVDAFEFHSAIAINSAKTVLYTCIEISDNAVAVYKREGNSWKYNRTLGDNVDIMFSFCLSEDEHYLIGTVALGYKLYDLHTDKMRELKLPHGTRNIPTKNQLTSLVVFTKNNQFVVAGVRKNLYVWDVKQGNMVKVLDAHFGRICALTSVTTGRNAVISSSMDKTIKVWNFDKILEDVHPIDRLERPIETIALASESPLCATTTRNTVAIWNLETGRLVKTFVGNARSAIVSHAVITADGEYVVSAESPKLLIWDISKEEAPLVEYSVGDIQSIVLTEEDTKVVVAAKLPGGKGQCVCLTVPEGQEVYKFEYVVKKFRNPVITKEGLYLAVPSSDKSGDVIGVYHAKTGARMYNLQLKYQNYVEYTHLVAMPHDPTWVAVVDPDKGNILDLKKKALVRAVPRWNGQAMQDGKIGLYAPARGGLELINLKSTKTTKVLIPKVAEGVFQVTAFFTQNDKHVVYYHSRHRTLRLFRISDGKMLANYKTSAEVKAIEGNEQGTCIVIGCLDGSLTALAVADPEDENCQEMLESLPSRNLTRKLSTKEGDDADADGDLLNAKNPMGAALQVARFVAKARGVQKSRACVIS